MFLSFPNPVVETITVAEERPSLESGLPERPVVEDVQPVGRTCDVRMDIPGVKLPVDFKKLTATLQRPNSKKEEKCRDPGSNWGPSDLQPDALPTELSRQMLKV